LPNNYIKQNELTLPQKITKDYKRIIKKKKNKTTVD